MLYEMGKYLIHTRKMRKENARNCFDDTLLFFCRFMEQKRYKY